MKNYEKLNVTLVQNLRRKIAELNEAKKKYKTIVENTKDIVYSYLPNGIIDYISPQISLLGYTPEEAIGKRVIEFVHPDDREYVLADIKKTIEIGKDFPTVCRVVKKDGNFIWIEETSKTVREDGRIVKLNGTIRDITERKKAEEKLKESEEKYRILLENLPQKIFFKDRDSVYISCNKKYARDLNIKSDKIAGKTDYDFYPKKLAEKYRSDDKRIMEKGRIENIEEEYTQDGKTMFVHTVKTPVRNEKGKVIGIIGIFWDITKLKKMEKALKDKIMELKKLKKK